MNTVRIAAPIALTTLALSACGGSHSNGHQESTAPTTTTRPSVAVSVAPPSPQRNDTGRPVVTFDPCVDIGDSTIAKLGFDPATRKRNDLSADTYTFVGCDFDQKTPEGWTAWTLNISATNITLAEDRSRFQDTAENIKIAGHDAVRHLLTKGGLGTTCYLEMESPVGVVSLQLYLNPARATGNSCERIRQLAETVQQDLPKK
ncbi:DUF3558 domain-containing protein [Nocardia transvalensis]|uniref:DUF3558 domain-containing protein n=1 Tax=Nocardia transvalensis TaxID=37333 RepID=UPI00189444CA|nr:DUF3558 domain-containing protein [Nocardia transvalensis]MBF6332341.1 DUF3558 domain-containing protein [Nocardia transvalensis]